MFCDSEAIDVTWVKSMKTQAVKESQNNTDFPAVQ